jgi:1-acyl-sn-glycerol-3-phosphate acyltransferase
MPQPAWLSDLWYDLNYWVALTGLVLACGMRTEGRRNVPRRGPVLVLANHESYLDPPGVGGALGRRPYYLARKTLFRNPWVGAWLRSIHSVPVDQEGVAKEGLKAIIDLLKAGEVVVVFPEGERSWTGQMQPFKPGLLLVLKRLSVPVLPVGIAGAFEAWPRSQKFPRFSPPFWPANGADFAVSIGKVVPSDYFHDMEREQVLQDLFQRIDYQRQRARRLLRTPSGQAHRLAR